MDRQQYLVFIAVVSVMFRNISSQQCGGVDTYSIYQMMLKGHTYKTFKARPNSMDCRMECNSDVKCQSYNNVFYEDICELNNRTKEARPEDFTNDRNRYCITKAPTRVAFQCVGFEGPCYRVVKEGKSWNDADVSCKANGTQLIKIEFADENNFVNNEVLAGDAKCWIGLTDAETENVWKWPDGSTLAGYTNWGSNQPNNYHNVQHCGEIAKGDVDGTHYDGEWNDESCSKLQGYICEM